MATWKCQICGWDNAGKWDACAKCGSKKNPTPEDVMRLAAAKKKAADFQVSTTPTLEGYSIKKYHGIVTSFVVLGTGFLSDFGAGLADFTGGRASGYQGKLDSATNTVMTELTKKAIGRNPDINGLVGLKLDYTIAGNNMMVLCGTATAVQLEKI